MTLAMTKAAQGRLRIRFHQLLPETRRALRPIARYRTANCSSGGSADEPKGIAAQALAERRQRQQKAIQTDRFMADREVGWLTASSFPFASAAFDILLSLLADSGF
jgi:hypothetical protein